MDQNKIVGSFNECGNHVNEFKVLEDEEIKDLLPLLNSRRNYITQGNYLLNNKKEVLPPASNMMELVRL